MAKGEWSARGTAWCLATACLGCRSRPVDAAAPHPPPRHAVQSLYNSPRLPRPRTVNYIANIYSQNIKQSEWGLCTRQQSGIGSCLTSCSQVLHFRAARSSSHSMHSRRLPFHFRDLGVPLLAHQPLCFYLLRIIYHHSSHFSYRNGSILSITIIITLLNDSFSTANRPPWPLIELYRYCQIMIFD